MSTDIDSPARFYVFGFAPNPPTHSGPVRRRSLTYVAACGPSVSDRHNDSYRVRSGSSRDACSNLSRQLITVLLLITPLDGLGQRDDARATMSAASALDAPRCISTVMSAAAAIRYSPAANERDHFA